MQIALKIAYNGINYHGFARQPNILTVEGEVLEFLRQVNAFSSIKKPQFRYASRTDKKVSALGNVISFDTTLSFNQINKRLLGQFDDIIIYGYTKVEDEFYPRYAKSRKYRYFLDASSLDASKIINASKIFIGKHDFTNFARIENNKNPVREIEDIKITQKSNFLIFDFTAQTYLYNQIRRMISALIKIGKNKTSYKDIKFALDNPDKRIDFELAKAEPLVLMDILYDFEFIVEKDLYSKAKKLVLPFS